MSNDRASALDGGPAFPNAGESNRGICTQPQPGMSLRDWFAGQALIGLTTGATSADVALIAEGVRGGAKVSAASYVIADAMLAERAKEAK